MFQQQQESVHVISAEATEPGEPWSLRRKLLVIVAASLLAWVVWGGAGLLVWRALAS